jgi:hypothetical protein
MNTIKIIRTTTLLAALLFAFGVVNRVQAQTNAPAGTPLALLQSAHATLALADHDYKGHRVAAMHQIRAAIVELKGGKSAHEGQKRGTHHAAGHKGSNEPQATSDDQLRSAQAMLQQASTGLSGKPLEHVKEAIAQINTALSIK